MRAINPFDEEAKKIVIGRKILVVDTIVQALTEASHGNRIKAKELCLYARNLSLYAENSLQLRILNEDEDFVTWHSLDNLVKNMDSKLDQIRSS